MGSRNCQSTSKMAALFLLTLKEEHRLTQTAVDFALGQVRQMTNYLVQDLHSNILSKLQLNADINVPDLSSCFANINPFKGLETEYKQSKFYQQHFNLIVNFLVLLSVIFTIYLL